MLLFILLLLEPGIVFDLTLVSVDQAASESIPLSPQWLYTKPTELKMVIMQALVYLFYDL